MTAKDLLANMDQLGFQLKAHGDSILIRPRNRVTDQIRQAIKERKPELVALLRSRTPTNDSQRDWPPAKRCNCCGLAPPGHPFCPDCQATHKAGRDNLPRGLRIGPDGSVLQVNWLGTPWQKG